MLSISDTKVPDSDNSAVQQDQAKKEPKTEIEVPPPSATNKSEPIKPNQESTAPASISSPVIASPRVITTATPSPASSTASIFNSPKNFPVSASSLLTPPNTVDPLQVKRRSSSRPIKRKKFDDELVESSLVKSTKAKLPTLQQPEVVPSSSSTTTEPAPVEKKKISRATTVKRTKKPKAVIPTLKDVGRWKPQDDLALITGVQQTNDLKAVYTGVKFSCHFTPKEVEERWYALLYDPAVSKVAQQAMAALHPDIKVAVLSKALYSVAEEKLLGTITSMSQPTVDIFQNLLNDNPTVFHPTRTAKILQTHWLLMKQYHLLPDQSVQPMPKGDHVLNFSDAEDMLTDANLKNPSDEVVEQELTIADRRQKREIRHLENEIAKWQVLVDHVTGLNSVDFDNQTLAVLRGRLVRYLMRSKEITLGRSTKDNNIDVDLSLEGPAWKISRRQGIIKLRNSGDFYIANEGTRPIYIDGKPILKGQKHKLDNNSVVEITGLRFIFLINQDLINAIRSEAAKIGF
ncbi:microspherule protein 1-like [Antedon mediterranea]|uniref:microspherule protein 1-like n=1 Tax=Antedon mediterranea TaxID=105859 RepID=UPI003AF66F82